jgi:predicted regulator of Ras-like GTPase activity (Roadblock/LC7/MglB family)
MTEHPPGPTVTLQEALRPLLETAGVLGGVLCTADGLPMAAALKDGLDEEGLAAAGARLGQLAWARLRGDKLDVAVLDATRLRLVVRAVSLGYLTLVADPAGNIEPALAAARQVGEALDEAATALAASGAVSG